MNADREGWNERRLAALEMRQILDTAPEPELDDVVALVSAICEVPIALISLVDADRQWFKAKVGVEASQTGLDTSVCALAIRQDDIFVIEDLAADARTRHMSLVAGAPHIRFYAGAPLITRDGYALGSLCAIDTVARPGGLTPQQRQTLQVLARHVVTQIDLRRNIQTREQALRHSEQQWMLLIQGVTDYSIYMLDPIGTVTHWNLGAERIMGYLPDEIIGEHFSRFYTEANRAGGAPDKALEIAAAEGRIEQEGWRVRKDGSQFWANAIIDAIRDDGGQLIGFAKITRDITAQKESQRALEEAREALFQSQKMEAIGQLTGGIAHDFNNLLTGISGSLQLMESRLAQGRVRELDRFLGSAQASAKRAAALTQRLLAFSRRQTLDPKPVNINRLVAEMDELVRRTAGPTIEVETIAAAGLWTTLVDANQLENALLNLCINARDAMPGGGRLTVETANKSLDARGAHERDLAPGEYVALCVSDTGCGMSKDVIERAFEPFFTTKPLGEGTGLGLSMVYGFVRQSAGQARIYSEIGQGTMVCLYLPRYDGEDETVEKQPELSEVQQAENGETVLVVDDEPSVRMLITEVLGDLGYRAMEAGDGPSGLKLLQTSRRIDLLITDVGLPGGMNGRQLAEAALALRPQLKVLFITGYAENAVVGNGQLQSGMHILTKPFALDELGRRIKNILETK